MAVLRLLACFGLVVLLSCCFLPLAEEILRATDPLSVVRRLAPAVLDSVSVEESLLPGPNPDVTAVLLNWSRLPNVILIASLLCLPILNDIISQVVVWNNSPNPLSYETFLSSHCPRSKLKIHNSPTNLYFGARFYACANSATEFCFLQDDDYLIVPNILRALRHSMLQNRRDIFLLPPQDMMLSQFIKTITQDGRYHFTAAWLGYGSLISRARASVFLATIETRLPMQTFRMADNYYSILSNTIPDIWLDQNIGLGLGVPFTVGEEGLQRNWLHFVRTFGRSRLILNCSSSKDKAKASLVECIENPDCANDFTNKQVSVEHQPLWKTPCLWFLCLVTTNVKLLEPLVHHEKIYLKKSLESLERRQREMVSKASLAAFSATPLSNVVDGSSFTIFRANKANKDDFVMIDTFIESHKGVEVIFCPEVMLLLAHTTYAVSLDPKGGWILIDGTDVSNGTFGFKMEPKFKWRYWKMLLTRDINEPWCILEILTHNRGERGV